MSDLVNLGASIGAIITGFGVIGSLFYLHNQNRQERIASDERWAALKVEADNRFLKSDDRWAALKTESDDRWSHMFESFTVKNVTVKRFAKVGEEQQK